jgi:hypothetical protein
MKQREIRNVIKSAEGVMKLVQVGMSAEHPDPYSLLKRSRILAWDSIVASKRFGLMRVYNGRGEGPRKPIETQGGHRQTAQLRRSHAFENCIVPAIDLFVPEQA